MIPFSVARGAAQFVIDLVVVANELRKQDNEPEHVHKSLTRHEAGRIGLEMVMVMRQSRENPGTFQPMMQAIMDDLDCTEQIVDVAMSLAGMVAVLAKDEDMTRFGEFILRHEVQEMP
jgi:hypothetical protein